VLQVDGRRALEYFAGEVAGRAGSCGAEIELAGHALRKRDQIRNSRYWLRGMHHDRDRRHRHERDGCEIVSCVISQLLIERGIDGVRADGAHEQRAPIGRGFGDGVCAQGAARATAIVDDDRCLECIAQQLGQRSCHDVSRTARRKRNHQANLPASGRLGGSHLGQCEKGKGGRADRHDESPGNENSGNENLGNGNSGHDCYALNSGARVHGRNDTDRSAQA